MENEKMQKDKLNTDYLLMKKKIVIHKDKHVHKWQTLSPTPRDNCLTVPKSWQGQNTIPDTKGQLFDCPRHQGTTVWLSPNHYPRHQGTTVWLSPTPRDNCLTVPDTKGQLFDYPRHQGTTVWLSPNHYPRHQGTTVWLSPNHVWNNSFTTRSMTSEQMRETVRTIDHSIVRERGPFIEFQKTVKIPKYIYIRY